VTRPVRAPEIRELSAFCAAVDLGSISAAARPLRTTQPALSKRLRTLEAGRRLYVAARRLLTDSEAISALMEGFASTSVPIRLTASHAIAQFVLPGCLAQFEAERSQHLSLEPRSAPRRACSTRSARSSSASAC